MSSPAFTFPSTSFSQNHQSRSFSSGPPRRPRTAFCSLPHQSHKVRTNAAEAACIPQTIEFAIRRAQAATVHALYSGVNHIRVELPMGRSRKHWYRMSPVDLWYKETSVLAFHFCELFKGLEITLVLGTVLGVTESVHWLQDLCRAEDVSTHKFSTKSDRVVVLAGISQQQRAVISYVLNEAPAAKAYILFNCMLDAPLSRKVSPFKIAYACRALEKCAILKDSIATPWAVFVEIAVFEYEWIGVREAEPTQGGIETFVIEHGARRVGSNSYYETDFAGCEAGFWPFMTVCCRDVLPIDGTAMAKFAKEKAEKKARKTSRPFGFF